MDLRLMTDASHVGGGFVIQFRPEGHSDYHTIWADAWCWKKTQTSWHCNRLEGDCLFRGLRALSKFVDFTGDSRFGSNQATPVHAVVVSDSATAVAWSRKCPQSQGYEVRGIERLSLGLRGEVHNLRKTCASFSLNHIDGASNGEADCASRLLSRPCLGVPSATGIATVTTIGALQRQRLLESKKSKRKGDDVDTAFRTTEACGDPRALCERISAESYDLAQALETIELLRTVLRAWGAKRREDLGTENRAELTSNAACLSRVELSATDLLCLSAQSLMDEKSKSSSNPFSVSANGVVIHERWQFDGSIIKNPVIPRAARLTQLLIIRTYHRLNHHRGVRHTASSVKGFWLESLVAATQAVVKKCFRCARKNAAVQWSLPTQTYERDLLCPAYTRVAIDFLHLEKTIACSVMCLDTGVLSLFLTNPNGTTTEAAVDALKRLCNRFYVGVKLIHADRASSFTSPMFAESLVRAGLADVKVQFTTPNAPYTNPVERLHREVLSIIRSQKFLRRCILDDLDRCSIQDRLDEICHIINTRPVGLYEDDGCEEILTPAKIAFAGRGIYNKRLLHVRKYFYDRCFEQLRRTHQSPQGRRGYILVGQTCLLYHPDSPKLESPFELCRVVDIQSPYFVVRLSSGVEKKVGSSQLAPLTVGFSLQAERQPQSTDVTRAGARISVEFSGVTFPGVVVKDLGYVLEVEWDALVDMQWRNELVHWRDCSIISD
jgi:hypothetical protein